MPPEDRTLEGPLPELAEGAVYSRHGSGAAIETDPLPADGLGINPATVKLQLRLYRTTTPALAPPEGRPHLAVWLEMRSAEPAGVV